jgi:hypothetical protein
MGRTWEEECTSAPDAGPPRAWWLPALRQGASQKGTPRGTGSHDSLTWRLEPDTGAPAVAREISLAVLREWNMARFASNVELVASELVTNALRHGPNPGPCGITEPPLVQLSMLRRGGELVCAVRDTNDRLPVRREPDFMLETGRGLHLVSCFATSWGAVPTVPVGKFVWALFS